MPQVKHSVALLAVLYVPARQLTHATALRPNTALNLPGAQNRHDESKVWLLYEPGKHGEGATLPLRQKLPAGQATLTDGLEQNDPDGHNGEAVEVPASQ